MHIWMNLLVVLQMLAAMGMIGLVLMQHGKGADMGASFGSGASGSLFGATGSANFLSRTTAVWPRCSSCDPGPGLHVEQRVACPACDTGSVLEKAAPAVPQSRRRPGAASGASN
jgi:preprotein translocase subunit SecG